MALNWYNSNLGRTFPFRDGTVNQRPSSGFLENISNALIVDAGFIAGLEAGFVQGVHSIWLETLSRVPGPVFYFDFASDAPGLAGIALRFTRTSSDEPYVTEFVESDESDVSSETSAISQSLLETEPRFSGFIVTGWLGKLIELLPDDNTQLSRQSATGALVEPALIQNMAESYLSGISLANDDRTRVTAVPGCPPVVWDYPTGQGVVFVQSQQLHGDVRFSGGYNISVTQDTANNAIVLSAEVGAGAGQLCNSEVALFGGETGPVNADSSLLEGGPLCGQTISSINGLGGSAAEIAGGVGVNIIPLPEQSTLIVDVNLLNLSACVGSSETSEISETL
jgi:hypothetical protein